MVKLGEAFGLYKTYKNKNRNTQFTWVGTSIDGKQIYVDNSQYTEQDLVGKHVVYMFTIHGGTYIGTTNNIVRRLHEHFTRRDSGVYKHLSKENCIYATICKLFETEDEAKFFESGMIAALQHFPSCRLINRHI